MAAAGTRSVPIEALGAGAQNTARAQQDHSMSKPGQQNHALVALNPNSDMPPPTDHGTTPPSWYSFDLTHRRVQEGGWTHQVTERELPSSRDLAGVNMRLTAGSFRELHWHMADEWAYMLKGNARITVYSPDGTMFVDDVAEGDLWIFPAGYPHSIQGTGEDGCEFLLVFNQGDFSEEDTFLLSDWLMHTPPDVLEQNLGVSADLIARLPKDGPLYIFPGSVPQQTLDQDRKEAEERSKGKSKQVFTFRTSTMPPTFSTEHGSVRVIDQKVFPASTKITASILRINAGRMRELHWHPNASEWQFWIKGRGRMTVFNSQGNAKTTDFNPNDVGFAPRMSGHYIENTGDEEVVLLAMFATNEYQSISLSQWLRALPANIAMAHTNFSAADLEKISFTDTEFK